ncbi:serine hydrolase [Streptomyces sodiiphilus]|uniref:Serine hydrolase n=1 Tax=Streptomyces sodiiphilus TaxID=226217 RepID=A0ABP5ATY3_9ACTN
MGAGGWSPGRLDRMRRVLTGHVDSGRVPGLVALVCRRGEVRVEALGAMAAGGGSMREDAVFRISSMTKPMLAVAAMILVEECRLRLDDPVDGLLPELAARRVMLRPDGPLGDTEPALRPVTLRDLLTHRMGFGILLAPPDQYPVQRAVGELELCQGPPKPATPHGPDEWMRRFGTLPLMHQPGERWMYHTAFDVLGVLLARASGQPLEEFLRERLFEPLGMTDTGFHVPPSALDRLTTSYARDPETGGPALYDGVEDSQWSRPPVFPSGAGGLVSTAADCLAFGQMLLRGGRHGGVRVLSRPSVELMTTDQLTPAHKARSAFGAGFWDSRGWGLGMSVVTRRDQVGTVPGQFGWNGGLGTSWYSDPAEEMTGVLLTQCMEGAELSPVEADFWTCAYQAVDD